jgi:preprotein translocase subunit SecE
VTESSTAKTGSRAVRQRPGDGNPFSRFFAALTLFVRQILDELRKVVRPTGSELLNYTVVVILFVLAIMGIVAGLDFLLHRLVLWVFAGS